MDDFGEFRQIANIGNGEPAKLNNVRILVTKIPMVILCRCLWRGISCYRSNWSLCRTEEDQNIVDSWWHSDDDTEGNCTAEESRFLQSSAHCQVSSVDVDFCDLREREIYCEQIRQVIGRDSSTCRTWSSVGDISGVWVSRRWSCQLYNTIAAEFDNSCHGNSGEKG